jgi:hypothetical protein
VVPFIVVCGLPAPVERYVFRFNNGVSAGCVVSTVTSGIALSFKLKLLAKLFNLSYS